MPAIDINEDRTVNSLDELALLVQPFRTDGEWIFRGVRESKYELLPKVGRWGNRKGLGSPEDLPYDRDEEETMTKHFIRRPVPM
jgi:hypothetical protein